MNSDSFICTIVVLKDNALFDYSKRILHCNCKIDFGDGETKTFKNKYIKHLYEKKGKYDIVVEGNAPAILNSTNNLKKIDIIDIKQWGNVDGMTDWSWSFSACKYLTKISASDTPNLIKTVGMFKNSVNFNTDVSNWDLSKVRFAGMMFDHCENFNCNLSKWNVSNITSMYDTFNSCKNFNCDLSNWDVSNLISANFMFRDCENFNSDISNWNTKSLKYMTCMFYNCINFDSDLSNWDISNVIDMTDAFFCCKNNNKQLINIFKLNQL